MTANLQQYDVVINIISGSITTVPAAMPVPVRDGTAGIDPSFYTVELSNNSFDHILLCGHIFLPEGKSGLLFWAADIDMVMYSGFPDCVKLNMTHQSTHPGIGVPYQIVKTGAAVVGLPSPNNYPLKFDWAAPGLIPASAGRTTTSLAVFQDFTCPATSPAQATISCSATLSCLDINLAPTTCTVTGKCRITIVDPKTNASINSVFRLLEKILTEAKPDWPVDRWGPPVDPTAAVSAAYFKKLERQAKMLAKSSGEAAAELSKQKAKPLGKSAAKKTSASPRRSGK